MEPHLLRQVPLYQWDQGRVHEALNTATVHWTAGVTRPWPLSAQEDELITRYITGNLCTVIIGQQPARIHRLWIFMEFLIFSWNQKYFLLFTCTCRLFLFDFLKQFCNLCILWVFFLNSGLNCVYFKKSILSSWLFQFIDGVLAVYSYYTICNCLGIYEGCPQF